MKLKKLWAMLVVFALLVPSFDVMGATDNDDNGNIYYWEDIVSDNGNRIIYNFPTNDELSDSNTASTGDRRLSGGAEDDVRFVVVQNYEEVSNSYYNFNNYYDEISGGNYNVSPTPTYYDEVSPSYVVTPAPTILPSPDTQPTVTPVPPVIKPDKQGNVYIIPEEKTPQKVSFDVDLEVGRLAHIKPQQAVNDTKTSSNTKIINDPRLATGSFNAEYEARANNPGQATLTFYNSKENFTEEWNVNVYCRP